MSLVEVAEKAAMVGVSALVSAAAGYVIAAITMKKSLSDSVLAAKAAIDAKVLEESEKSKAHCDAEIKKLDKKLDDEVAELKKEDLAYVREQSLKATHDAKNAFTAQFAHIQHDIDVLEKKTEGVVKAEDFRRFNEEQTSRWEAVQRSLGFIEGQLKTIPPPGRRP